MPVRASLQHTLPVLGCATRVKMGNFSIGNRAKGGEQSKTYTFHMNQLSNFCFGGKQFPGSSHAHSACIFGVYVPTFMRDYPSEGSIVNFLAGWAGFLALLCHFVASLQFLDLLLHVSRSLQDPPPWASVKYHFVRGNGTARSMCFLCWPSPFMGTSVRNSCTGGLLALDHAVKSCSTLYFLLRAAQLYPGCCTHSDGG